MKLLILVQACLQKLDLISQVLHVLSDFFNLSTVLYHKPVCIDSSLNGHRCQNLHSIVVLILQTIQLQTEDLRQVRDPVDLQGLRLLPLKSLTFFLLTSGV